MILNAERLNKCDNINFYDLNFKNTTVSFVGYGTVTASKKFIGYFFNLFVMYTACTDVHQKFVYLMHQLVSN